MRWKKKPEPKYGDKRIVKKFLFIPKELNGQVRWLEKVEMVQRNGVYGWFPYAWRDEWEE